MKRKVTSLSSMDLNQPIPMGLLLRPGKKPKSYESLVPNLKNCTVAAGTPRPASLTRIATASPQKFSIPPSACCSATILTSTIKKPALMPTICGSLSMFFQSRASDRSRTNRDALGGRRH